MSLPVHHNDYYPMRLTATPSLICVNSAVADFALAAEVRFEGARYKMFKAAPKSAMGRSHNFANVANLPKADMAAANVSLVIPAIRVQFQL